MAAQDAALRAEVVSPSPRRWTAPASCRTSQATSPAARAALIIVNDWIKLAALTGKAMWRERAVAAWANASIGVSNGALVVMGKKRPYGSQDEGFLHTRSLQPFAVSQWLVAWPTAFRLETLRQNPNWSVFNKD